MTFKFALTALTLATSAMANASVVTINDPSYALSTYANPTPTTIETHVIGVYETRSDHGGGIHPEGLAYVNVTGSATGPVNLVLSSYEPTNWVLGGDGLSSVDSITINGYHSSRVSGFDASSVIDRTGLGNYISACARAWPNSTGGCDTPTLIAGVEGYYGAAVTSFSGAYRATSFSVALSAVPEPSAIALVGFGLLAAVFQVRRNGSKSISKT